MNQGWKVVWMLEERSKRDGRDVANWLGIKRVKFNSILLSSKEAAQRQETWDSTPTNHCPYTETEVWENGFQDIRDDDSNRWLVLWRLNIEEMEMGMMAMSVSKRGCKTTSKQDIPQCTFLPVASTAMPSTVLMAAVTTGLASWPLCDTLKMMAAALSGRKMSPASTRDIAKEQPNLTCAIYR